jgi:hypothetical protein
MDIPPWTVSDAARHRLGDVATGAVRTSKCPIDYRLASVFRLMIAIVSRTLASGGDIREDAQP